MEAADRAVKNEGFSPLVFFPELEDDFTLLDQPLPVGLLFQIPFVISQVCDLLPQRLILKPDGLIDFGQFLQFPF